MTDAGFRAAIAGLGKFTIGTDAGLAVKAPEEAIIAGWHGWIRLSQNELTFPAQGRAEVGMMNVEALRFADHTVPPAAFKMARLTATHAN